MKIMGPDTGKNTPARARPMSDGTRPTEAGNGARPGNGMDGPGSGRTKKTCPARKNVNKIRTLIGMGRLGRVFPGTQRVRLLLPVTSFPDLPDWEPL